MNEKLLDGIEHSRQIYNTRDSSIDIYSANNIPEHIYLLAHWANWNAISEHVNKGRFDIVTKSCANSLILYGADSKFIQCLANGNLLFPDDVVETALEFEKLDNYLRRNTK